MYKKNIFIDDWKNHRLKKEKIYIWVEDDDDEDIEIEFIQMDVKTLRDLRQKIKEEF